MISKILSLYTGDDPRR